MSGLISTTIKLSLKFIGVTIIVIVAILGIFIATFDANQYKQDLSDLVYEETGRDLQFYSDVGLTFFPTLGMELGALSLSNAQGFGSEPMLKVNKVSISVDVASIIAFNPEIDELILDGLEINIHKNKNGVTNWDDLVRPEKTELSNSTQSGSSDEQMTLSGAFGGLNITNARLSWVDEQAGEEYKVESLNIKTSRITAEAPFDLEVEVELAVALESGGELTANVDIETQVQYVLDAAQVNMSGLVLNVAAAGEPLPRGKMQASVASEVVVFKPQQHSVALKGLVLTVDDNQLTGEINISDYRQPAVSFNLATGSLDMDVLLDVLTDQAGSATSGSSSGETQGEQDIQISLPMALLRTIGIEGELSMKQLKVQNLLLNDIDVSISAANGIVNLDPITMNLYDGSFSGLVRLDARSDLPKYQVNQKIQSVQLEKLLADFLGEDRISGVLDADAVITTHGEWLSELKKNSNGKVKLAAKDGALNGFNLRYSIDKAKAQFKGQVLPPKEVQKTDFSSLELSGTISNGVINSKDLNLQAPIMRVGGEGQASLIDNTVDYLVRAKLVGTIAGQDGGDADDLTGLTIPVRIYGSFADPKVDVQLEEMLKGQVAEKVAQLKETKRLELEKQEKALKDKLKAELEKAKTKLLGGLFN
jgi:AsmA protein